MGVTVAVAGASGYVGGELLRILAGHPEFEIGIATANTHVGAPISAVHPHLVDLDLTFKATNPEVLGGAELVFLALPHGESAAVAERLPAGQKIIDLGADHRLVDPYAWTSYYGGPHADPWTYGLPELPGQRELIAASDRVAATGCYAGAVILALAPLLAAGIASPDDVVVVAASGTTGAGRTQKPGLLASEVMGDLTAYKVGAHQHTPEIKQATGARAVSFTPLLVPMPRGILATVTTVPGRRRRLLRRGPGRTADGVRQRAVRAGPARRHLAAHRGDSGQQRVSPPGRRGCRLRPDRRRECHRQSRQGRGRPGRAVREPHARAARDGRAHHPGDGAVTVTAPKGFRAAAVAAGLKASGGSDVAVVLNDGPDATAAGVFTANKVKAAPVLWSQQVLRAGIVRAVVLNSGGANACTGPQGFQDTHATAEYAAARLTAASRRLVVGAADIAICSTGLIGERLPMPKLLAGIDAAVRGLSRDGGTAAAEAIMTTDTRPKTTTVAGDGWSVGGMAKGAGMLAPALATMLCVLTTDAVAGSTTLDDVLREATRTTFDRLDSDGCQSTNDTVLLLASGASGLQPTTDELADAVTKACRDLARQLLGDAEGSTKDITIEVRAAASEADAVEAGRAVARSNLVKTALYGADPNWGRILSAVGTTGADFGADAVSVAINGVWVCRGGAASDDRSTVDLSDRDVHIIVDLGAGTDTATVWTNDLSVAYVHENSAYST